MSGRHLLLGVVARVHRRGDNPHARQRASYALLRPLYKTSPDGSELQAIENVAEEFPNRGFVTWYNPPQELQTGSLWQFRIEESFTYETTNPEHDQFFAAKSATPTSLREVIDLRSGHVPYEDEAVRNDVMHEGVWLPFSPSVPAYLWVEDQVIIGPLNLQQHEGRWKVSTEQTQQRSVNESSVPAGSIVELRGAGAKRYCLLPGFQAAPRRALDWSSDDILLRRVLHWLKKADPEYAAAANFTKEAVNRAASLVRSEAVVNGEGTISTQQLERALALVSTLERKGDLTQGIQEDLLSLPPVVALIEKASAEARQQAEAQVHNELASIISNVESLRLEKASLEEEVRRLDSQRAETALALSRQIEESKAALESAIEEQLTDIMNRPAQALANIAIFRTALGLIHTANAPAQTPTQGLDANKPGQIVTECPQFVHRDIQGTPISSEDDFRQSLYRALEAEQINPSVARSLHAAFVSGAMPVLAGDASYAAVAAYADSIACGRLLWIPVPATVLEHSDLLGRFNTEGRFIPNPCGLLELLLHAHGSDELFLVVLDGINRAPIDAYLNPLLAIYSDVYLEKSRRRKLSLLPPGIVESNSPYSAAAQLSWPPNVLLAGIWSEGAVGIPTPPSFWDATALILIEQLQEKSDSSDQDTSTGRSVSCISAAHWNAWRETNAQRKSQAPLLEKLINHLSDINVVMSKHRKAICTSYVNSVSTWGQTADEVISDTVLHCIAPRLVASGLDYQLVVEAISKQIESTNDLTENLQTMQTVMF